MTMRGCHQSTKFFFTMTRDNVGNAWAFAHQIFTLYLDSGQEEYEKKKIERENVEACALLKKLCY